MAKLEDAFAVAQGMTTGDLLETMRGLLSRFYDASSGTDKAIQACAIAHLFHIMDAMLTAGHMLPPEWQEVTFPPHDTNAG